MFKKEDYCPEALKLEPFLKTEALPKAFREEKYIVLKRSEIEEIIETDKATATIITEGIHRYNAFREANGKPDNKYIICNQDEPYAEKVWEVILRGEIDKGEAHAIKSGEPTPDEPKGCRRTEAVEAKSIRVLKCPACNSHKPFQLYELEPDNVAPFAFYYECPACLVCSPMAVDDDKETAKAKAKANLESFSKLKLIERKRECSCTLAQKLTGDGCSVCNPEMEIEILGQENNELKEALRATLEYIDAIPKEISFPEMPGFDRDWVDSLL